MSSLRAEMHVCGEDSFAGLFSAHTGSIVTAAMSVAARVGERFGSQRSNVSMRLANFQPDFPEHACGAFAMVACRSKSKAPVGIAEIRLAAITFDQLLPIHP